MKNDFFLIKDLLIHIFENQLENVEMLLKLMSYIWLTNWILKNMRHKNFKNIWKNLFIILNYYCIIIIHCGRGLKSQGPLSLHQYVREKTTQLIKRKLFCTKYFGNHYQYACQSQASSCLMKFTHNRKREKQ